MAREIIDDRLIGALHVRALTRAGLDHDAGAEHLAVQAGTAEAVFAGGYDGDAALSELMRLGTLGLGTVQNLDGELIVLDGQAWAIRGDGRVERLPPQTRTPFAVLVPFEADVRTRFADPLDWRELCAALDAAAPVDEPVLAIRLDGHFASLHLRSVMRQSPPYRPLAQVAEQQTEWHVEQAQGTAVGFRFPDVTSGIQVPGWHMHFLATDRSSGGHVLSAKAAGVDVAIAAVDELHVELPDGVALGSPNGFDIAAAERIESDA